MNDLSDKALEARRAYYREHRKNNPYYKAYKKKWDAEHPEKNKQYQKTFWEKKAKENEKNNAPC